jgi:hypothetical protein
LGGINNIYIDSSCSNFTLNITYYIKNKRKKEDLFQKI